MRRCLTDYPYRLAIASSATGLILRIGNSTAQGEVWCGFIAFKKCIIAAGMLAHKAVHEAHVAAEVIAGELQGNKELAAAAFNARVIPSVAYTDPEVAWVGLTEDQAKAQGIKVKKGLFPWTASGRAIANGRDEGVTKLLFDDSPEAHGHGKILGGGMVGTHAGDMIGEVALAIEMGADAVDIGKTIHPHPTLGESIGMAAEVAHGSCTDLPPTRK